MDFLLSGRLGGELPPNFFPSRRQAHAALRRMFTRGRRQDLPLTLIRMGLPRPTDKLRPVFLSRLSSEMRLTDLAWWDEETRAFLFLAEASADAAPLIARWLEAGREWKIAPQVATQAFPRQGATLGALLEGLR